MPIPEDLLFIRSEPPFGLFVPVGSTLTASPMDLVILLPWICYGPLIPVDAFLLHDRRESNKPSFSGPQSDLLHKMAAKLHSRFSSDYCEVSQHQSRTDRLGVSTGGSGIVRLHHPQAVRRGLEEENDGLENSGLERHNYNQEMRKMVTNTCCSDGDDGSLPVSPLSREEENTIQLMFNLDDSSEAFLPEERACRVGNDPNFLYPCDVDDLEEEKSSVVVDLEEEEERYVHQLFRGGGERFARKGEEGRWDCGPEKEKEGVDWDKGNRSKNKQTGNPVHTIPMLFTWICHKMTTCAMSDLVHIITNIRLPTVDAYGTRDIFILSASLLGLILKDNLKLTGSGIEIGLQSCTLKHCKIFLR
ncbi:hypothetical protein FNV43_RR04279 [Rhamnella rubrinervis]|uniref:Uncharacterized protein n=1 Tax=Rhamnella rubrinervis TaxID=2594499 RepID=A0A8K0HLL1_9ROSA|nr:hypothetical protein FNV43_RR04279 [Rhamnella rubrinervis]